MNKSQLKELTLLALNASLAAGKKILEIYNSAFSVEFKDDHSPLTEADKTSHRVIADFLKSSDLPVLSEEGKIIAYDERKKWEYYWLVDPLDGTKEFISRNGEFTVNIALMKGGSPVAGVIYQPTGTDVYAGIEGDGLYKCHLRDGNQSIELMINETNKIKTKTAENNPLRVIVSRSHRTPDTFRFINDLRANQKDMELMDAGSSLKFCLLAEGNADIYPRFAPTMEWDTAAGHALLKSVGKNIYTHPSGTEMTYNKPKLVNDWFIAR